MMVFEILRFLRLTFVPMMVFEMIMFLDELLTNLQVEIKHKTILEQNRSIENVCRRFAEELESGDDQEDKEAKSHL